jgi:hypothetical protein
MISSNRYFTCVPAENFDGNVTFVLEVGDPDGASIQDSFVVNFNPENDVPVIKDIPQRTMDEDSPMSFSLIPYGNDVEDLPAELTWKATDGAFVSTEVDAEATITLVPEADISGTDTITVTVTDTEGASATANFTVVVNPVNDPPTISPISSQQAFAGKELTLSIEADDPDLATDPLEKLTYSDNTQLFDVDPENGTIAFTPTWVQVGTYHVNITVTDNGGEEATAQMELSVDFPAGTGSPTVEITSPENGTKVKTKKDIDFKAVMRDGGSGDWNITWKVDGEPVAYGEEAPIKFTTKGTHEVTVTATDGNGTVEDSITIIAKPKKSGSGVPGMEAVVLLLALIVLLCVSGRRTDD